MIPACCETPILLFIFDEMMVKRILILMIMALAIVSSLLAQDAQAIAERLDLQRYKFPQEKIHVMTDRGAYLAGDTLWLRVWVVDAATHQPVSASKFVYVELMSPTDSLCASVKIHQDDDGVFQGYLPLPDDLPEGRYQLTAYTLFMQNAGADYFYRQPVEIAGLMSLERRITARCVRFDDEVEVRLSYTDLAGEPREFSNCCYLNQYRYISFQGGGKGEARFTLKGKEASKPVVLVEIDGYAKFIPLPASREVLVDFYPEGGYLVPGVENAVAFKMHDPDHLTVKTSGELVDEQGVVVAPLLVEHDGMGLVRFTPRVDGRYTARWRDNFDEFVTFDLPQVRPDATVVQVRHDEDGQIDVRAAGAHGTGALLLQQRGCLIAASQDAITLNENEFSAGVVQALLIDESGRCLSERLFFVQPRTLFATTVETERPVYNSREAVKVTVDMNRLVMGADGGDCAVAVVDNRAAVIAEGDIFSNLLLQSDLRGNVHDPGYYFRDDDSIDVAERSRHLDMLMLTQGWRRYDIPRVLKGLVAEPQYPLEVSQVVAGRVLSEFRKKPLANAEVDLIIPKMEYANVATTDSLGRFSIPVPLIPDGVDCIVLAMNDKGKKQTNLELTAEQYPEYYYMIDADTSNGLTVNVQEELAKRLISEDDWRHIKLDELMVYGASRRQRKPTVETHRFLTADDISRMGITSVDGALGAMGVSDYSKVIIKIDGEVLQDLYFTDSETVTEAIAMSSGPRDRNDKQKGVNFAALSTGTNYELSQVSLAEGFVSMKNVAYISHSVGRGGTRAINIIRKPGTNKEWKEPSRYAKIAHPMGAQQPVEYYSPRYDQDDCGIEPGNDLRRVLYWNPQVKVGEDGMAQFDFYCNDAPNTTYTILVEGVTDDGKLIHGTQSVTKR